MVLQVLRQQRPEISVISGKVRCSPAQRWQVWLYTGTSSVYLLSRGKKVRFAQWPMPFSSDRFSVTISHFASAPGTRLATAQWPEGDATLIQSYATP